MNLFCSKMVHFYSYDCIVSALSSQLSGFSAVSLYWPGLVAICVDHKHPYVF